MMEEVGLCKTKSLLFPRVEVKNLTSHGRSVVETRFR